MRMTIRLALLFLLAAVITDQAGAADLKILDGTVDRYMEEAARWEPAIKAAATRLFWTLAAISLVFTGGWMFIKGNASIGDFFGEFLRFGITTGTFYWLLENGSTLANLIIKSFAELGKQASSTYEAELTPSNIISFGLGLVGRSVKSFGDTGVATGIVALLLSVAVAVLFAIIAAQMVLLLCSAWVLVYAGIIYLGFGGGKWTTDIAINYFKTVLGLAVQTFVFSLLVGVGQSQVERLITDSEQVKTIAVSGIWGTKQVQSTTLTITEVCVILVFTVVLFCLLKTLPTMVAGVINGSGIGGMGWGGGGAAGLGASMLAMQAAGATMALASAFTQARSDLKNGNSSLFQKSGGLTGAMNTGLLMAGKLAAGTARHAMDRVQQSSFGGGIASQIKAASQGMAGKKNEKKQDDQDGGNNNKDTDSKSGSNESESFNGGGSISGDGGSMNDSGPSAGSSNQSAFLNAPRFGDDVSGPMKFGEDMED